MDHVQTVREIYQAFGQGDIPGILEHLADDVEWEYGVVSTDVPWLQPHRGRDAVSGFFEALAAVDIQQFEPTTFLQSGDVVVVLLDLTAIVRSNGARVVEEDEVHIWYFDSSGRVRRFRHRADTHQHWVALHGR